MIRFLCINHDQATVIGKAREHGYKISPCVEIYSLNNLNRVRHLLSNTDTIYTIHTKLGTEILTNNKGMELVQTWIDKSAILLLPEYTNSVEDNLSKRVYGSLVRGGIRNELLLETIKNQISDIDINTRVEENVIVLIPDSELTTDAKITELWNQVLHE